MEMRINYQRALEQTLGELSKTGAAPRLLLHSCCAPCSSYVLEYLARRFQITVYYYNPNIHPEAEFTRRAGEQRGLLRRLYGNLALVVPDYLPGEFYAAASGYERAPEGGARCARCFALRLDRTAREARARGCDYFTTTLSVSPHKDAQLLNRIGREMSEKHGVAYLYADFKKGGGYARSVALSKELGLYRQLYCGCEFSIPAQMSGQ